MTLKPVIVDNNAHRLRWLMLSRVAIVTFLLGVATFVEVKDMGTLSAISASTLFRTILLTYVLSIAYVPLLKYIRSLTPNIYIQSLSDLILITFMVYGTGGIHSIYSVFYPLVIIYSVLFLGRRGGMVIASAAGFFYGLFVDLEFYGVISPVVLLPVTAEPPNAGYVFTRTITHILSFYFIAFLTSFVVEQEKRTRTLLAEKQSAFDQLDILHRSIVNSLDTGILSINPEGRIKSFNPAASEITGLSLQDVENHMLAEIFPDLRPFPNGEKTTAGTRFETSFHTADGRKLTLGGALSLLRDPRGLVIGQIIIFQNLTEIIEMRESLDKSRRLAFIGGMAATLAHEIRNPLASISGSIQMLKHDIPATETNQRLVQIILRGKEQLEGFLKDFLMMARPAPGVCEEIDIGGEIRDVIDALRCVPDWPENLRVDLVLPEGPAGMQANRTEIRQVLWNVVLNAVQSMPEGGHLTVEARAARHDGRDGTEIKIGDTGCGIRKEDLRKIFEPFYTTRDVGTGLGLAVVSRILEDYGGTIDIGPEALGGTTCRIWFPARVCGADTKRINT